MKHVPFFRWVVALGLVLIGCAVGVYMATSDYPELEQVDLTVLREDPDGACTVRWTDPYELGEHVGSYRCDAERDDILKAPDYEPGTNLGWDTGFVLAEGPHKGDLYSLDEDTDDSLRMPDQLLVAGLLLTITGVIGGNIRSLSRLSGVNPAVVRRARRLREAAAQVAKDHVLAVEAIRKAWAPLHEALVSEQLGRIPVAQLRKATWESLSVTKLERNGIRTVRDVLDVGAWGVAHASGLGRREAEKVWAAARRTADSVGQDTTVPLEADRPDASTLALLKALRVLVEAGPATRSVAERGGRLAATLEAGLADAAPASGWRSMLGAGREERKAVPTAVAELRRLLHEAEQDGVGERFAQASVDLLRGADGDPAGLSARVDYDTRPAEYYALLAEVANTPLRETAAPQDDRRH
ncbi:MULTISPECIES: hypothetical protein [unclassified Streptomyces]|uniref:hypothetical protein n=1 Tax=unclassified Streptomyces TaxID=2593676 RepID=UPI00087CE340|nr:MULTISPECIES: hypothetical protein [unclassified Streptomyces]REH23657.1 hypothetical protein BX268_5549 [Streptomyces sp. 2221.1]SDT75190.1 hypothetical protein SAMN05428941_5540 [Streptomyces sp. 2114.2]